MMGEPVDLSMKRQLSVPVTLADIEEALHTCATGIATMVTDNLGDLQQLADDWERDENGELQPPSPFDDSNVNDLGIYASAYTELHPRLGLMQYEIERDRKAASSRVEGKRQVDLKLVG